MSRNRAEELRRYREAHWGLPVPDGMKHGPSTWAYKAYGCSCSVCLPTGKRTWRNSEGASGPLSPTERSRRLRHSKRGQEVPPNVKRGVYCWRTYRCGHPECREAITATRREKAAQGERAWRAAARGRWTKGFREGHDVDIICWPPRNAGSDWQCPHPSHQEAS